MNDGGTLTLPAPFRALAHDVLPSTSDEAKRLAAAGAADGTVVWARSQTGGRGRLGRVWSSPPGNLYLSVVLRPDVPAPRASELSFVAALAVRDFLAPHVAPGTSLTLKWPNDVLADGAKIAGILLETEPSVGWVVVGIGVNLVSAPVDTPYPATALGARAPSVEEAVGLLCGALGAALTAWRDQGFAVIRQRWLDHAHGVGAPIRLVRPDETIAGRFETLDADGALVIATESGLRRLTAGDVQFPAG